MERLEQAKQKKLKLLSRVNNMASLDDSYTDLGNGLIESNQNKIWNTLNAMEVQSLDAAAEQTMRLTKDAKGVQRFPDGTPYYGQTKTVYGFGTKDRTNDEYKYGITRYENADLRYNNPNYDSNVGPKGVSVPDKQYEAVYPADVAVILEGVKHGRQAAFDARTVKDLFGSPYQRDAYGSGASEYYNSREALLGTPQQVDVELGGQLLNKYLTELRDKLPQTGAAGTNVGSTLPSDEAMRRSNQEYAADHMGLLGRLNNARKGFFNTFVNELVLQPVEAVGDLSGLWDSSSASQAWSDFLDYNPVMQERAMAELGDQWDIITSEDAPIQDRLRAAFRGAAVAFTTPEMLADSGAVIAAWATPGSIFKLLKGSKYVNAFAKVDKALEAGDITKKAARAQKLEILATVPGMKEVLRKQSGHMIAALGNVNAQYKDFVQNYNNGVELEGAEKAAWFARSYGLQMVNQNLDALIAIDIVKNPGFFKALIPAVKSMTNKEFANVLKQVGKGFATTLGKEMPEEAVQEYIQTMMELTNSRYGSEMFKDQTNFIDFIMDERNTTEAGVAALAGAGGAAQFDAAGTILPATSATIRGAGALLTAGKQRRKQTPSSVSTMKKKNL